MAKPIHSMIRVLDEARSVTFYQRALGLEVIDRLAFDGFTLLYLRAPEGPFELELTVNHDRTEPYQLEHFRFTRTHIPSWRGSCCTRLG
jgi:lactoylglutathione lyase